jgi:hypothetical protein
VARKEKTRYKKAIFTEKQKDLCSPCILDKYAIIEIVSDDNIVSKRKCNIKLVIILKKNKKL